MPNKCRGYKRHSPSGLKAGRRPNIVQLCAVYHMGRGKKGGEEHESITGVSVVEFGPCSPML